MALTSKKLGFCGTYSPSSMAVLYIPCSRMEKRVQPLKLWMFASRSHDVQPTTENGKWETTRCWNRPKDGNKSKCWDPEGMGTSVVLAVCFFLGGFPMKYSSSHFGGQTSHFFWGDL